MGAGAAGLVVLGVLGELDFLGGSPLNYCQLPKTNDL